MIENIPSYVSWIFIITVAAAVILYLYAVWTAAQNKIFLFLTASALAFLLGAQAILAVSGFYLVTTIPPRFALTLLPTIVVLLILFFTFARTGISVKTLQILTLLSLVRVSIEIVLLWLYQNGQIPQLMTFEGGNFDIISGLTAPFVAWLAFRGGRINRPLLIGWNWVALVLLTNILVRAVLTLPYPFQQLAFDHPNRAVLYFPFIWLPAIVVPIVFASHVVSIYQLFKRKS